MNKEGSNNKIDTHVRSQLNKLSEPSFEWSDSDAIFWSGMQPQIDEIYRKKKNKKALILLFGSLLGIFFIASLIQYSYFSSDASISSNTIKYDQPIKQETFNTSTSINEKEIIQADNTSTNELLEVPNDSYIESSNENKVEAKTIKITAEIDNNNFIAKNENPHNINFNPGIQKNIALSDKNIPTSISIKNSSILDDLNKASIVEFSTLTTLTTSLEEKEIERKTLLATFIEAEPIHRNKWEIGIGHTQFVNNPLLFIPPNQLSDTKNIEIIDKRYESYNVLVNRDLNRFISISSGFHYMKQFVQLEYTLNNIPFEADENSLRNSLGDVIGRNVQPISDSFKKDQLFIKFLPGKEASVGDLLNAKGFGDVYLKFYQIPFQLNFHKEIGNFELVGFTGISINAVDIEIPRFDVQIFSDAELISTDINFTPLRDQIYIPNLILGAGIRYSIFERYHANLYLNGNPLDSRFARIQMGLTYSL